MIRAAALPELLEGVRPAVRVAAAAGLLNCDESHIRRLVREGALAAHRVGKRGVRIYLDSIAAYQAAGAVTPSAPKSADAPPPPPRGGSLRHRESMARLRQLGVL